MSIYQDLNIYHIFTMGFCGAETYQYDCQAVTHRLQTITTLKDYLKKMHINTVLLGPLLSSCSHGYDTIDYYTVDKRLGDNEDFRMLVDSFHQDGIKVMLDCVFNHVGREFFAFKDLQSNRENARYKDWLCNVNFWDNNSYNDGFRYDNWAGHDELVKLNLWNHEVRNYLKDVMEFWISNFDIDGVRMDAANVMQRDFLHELSDFSKSKKPGFFLMGEMVGGDYNVLVQEGGLDSVTNYEDYKGLYSSLNTRNYFEIAYSLNRLFGNYGIYKTFLPYNFVDNHDVNRIASTLEKLEWLEPLYLMLYTMPGIPSIYYGSEQGIKGIKGHGTDAPLRPSYDAIDFDMENSLYQKICQMAEIRDALVPLRKGGYRELFVKPQQMGYCRFTENEKVLILFNSEEIPVMIENQELYGSFYDCWHQKDLLLEGKIEIPACSGCILIPAEQAQKIRKVRAEEHPNPFPKLSMQDYMQEAIREAEKALKDGEVPIGAVVVHDGKIIARNHNQKEKSQDPTAHAEMLVIREAADRLGRWRLSDCELYVTAEPCPMCMGAIIQSRMAKVVYGTYERRYGSVETTAELGKHPMLANHTEFYSGICEMECQNLLKKFFEKTREG